MTNGRVLLVDSWPKQAAEVIDVVKQTVTPTAPFPHSMEDRTFPIINMADGRVFAFSSGWDITTGGSMGVLYDPSTNGWEVTPPCTVNGIYNGIRPQQVSAAPLTDGRVMICGGIEGLVTIPQVAIYDPNSHSWTQAEDMGTARVNHVCLPLPDGRILVHGGQPIWATSSSQASVEFFTP
jgi:hypothetical protein